MMTYIDTTIPTPTPTPTPASIPSTSIPSTSRHVNNTTIHQYTDRRSYGGGVLTNDIKLPGPEGDLFVKKPKENQHNEMENRPAPKVGCNVDVDSGNSYLPTESPPRGSKNLGKEENTKQNENLFLSPNQNESSHASHSVTYRLSDERNSHAVTNCLYFSHKQKKKPSGKVKYKTPAYNDHDTKTAAISGPTTKSSTKNNRFTFFFNKRRTRRASMSLGKNRGSNRMSMHKGIDELAKKSMSVVETIPMVVIFDEDRVKKAVFERYFENRMSNAVYYDGGSPEIISKVMGVSKHLLVRRSHVHTESPTEILEDMEYDSSHGTSIDNLSEESDIYSRPIQRESAYKRQAAVNADSASFDWEVGNGISSSLLGKDKDSSTHSVSVYESRKIISIPGKLVNGTLLRNTSKASHGEKNNKSISRRISKRNNSIRLSQSMKNDRRDSYDIKTQSAALDVFLSERNTYDFSSSRSGNSRQGTESHNHYRAVNVTTENSPKLTHNILNESKGELVLAHQKSMYLMESGVKIRESKLYASDSDISVQRTSVFIGKDIVSEIGLQKTRGISIKRKFVNAKQSRGEKLCIDTNMNMKISANGHNDPPPHIEGNIPVGKDIELNNGIVSEGFDGSFDKNYSRIYTADSSSKAKVLHQSLYAIAKEKRALLTSREQSSAYKPTEKNLFDKTSHGSSAKLSTQNDGEGLSGAQNIDSIVEHLEDENTFSTFNSWEHSDAKLNKSIHQDEGTNEIDAKKLIDVHGLSIGTSTYNKSISPKNRSTRGASLVFTKIAGSTSLLNDFPLTPVDIATPIDKHAKKYSRIFSVYEPNVLAMSKRSLNKSTMSIGRFSHCSDDSDYSTDYSQDESSFSIENSFTHNISPSQKTAGADVSDAEVEVDLEVEEEEDTGAKVKKEKKIDNVSKVGTTSIGQMINMILYHDNDVSSTPPNINGSSNNRQAGSSGQNYEREKPSMMEYVEQHTVVHNGDTGNKEYDSEDGEFDENYEDEDDDDDEYGDEYRDEVMNGSMGTLGSVSTAAEPNSKFSSEDITSSSANGRYSTNKSPKLSSLVRDFEQSFPSRFFKKPKLFANQLPAEMSKLSLLKFKDVLSIISFLDTGNPSGVYFLGFSTNLLYTRFKDVLVNDEIQNVDIDKSDFGTTDTDNALNCLRIYDTLLELANLGRQKQMTLKPLNTQILMYLIYCLSLKRLYQQLVGIIVNRFKTVIERIIQSSASHEKNVNVKNSDDSFGVWTNLISVHQKKGFIFLKPSDELDLPSLENTPPTSFNYQIDGVEDRPLRPSKINSLNDITSLRNSYTNALNAITNNLVNIVDISDSCTTIPDFLKDPDQFFIFNGALMYACYLAIKNIVDSFPLLSSTDTRSSLNILRIISNIYNNPPDTGSLNVFDKMLHKGHNSTATSFLTPNSVNVKIDRFDFDVFLLAEPTPHTDVNNEIVSFLGRLMLSIHVKCALEVDLKLGLLKPIHTKNVDGADAVYKKLDSDCEKVNISGNYQPEGLSIQHKKEATRRGTRRDSHSSISSASSFSSFSSLSSLDSDRSGEGDDKNYIDNDGSINDDDDDDDDDDDTNHSNIQNKIPGASVANYTVSELQNDTDKSFSSAPSLLQQHSPLILAPKFTSFEGFDNPAQYEVLGYPLQNVYNRRAFSTVDSNRSSSSFYDFDEPYSSFSGDSD
ncbi:hypothetical protein AX774_g5174 [Zancudomyces culisetae]|uniref:Uncharacterized protein n=1 Tax=Zancudomyces culisetae TaxID=1213189 RepID=A0A1R1PKG5_ZANCU|nr:hypothetical protein AX774_g5174 [Zancudomyces culisetae]|eukprot:OMH81372.1 hypothetical protein AX774_g5174 [Zancudomyces culisetae]